MPTLRRERRLGWRRMRRRSRTASLGREAACDAALAAVEALLLKQEPWRLKFLKAEEGVGEADANNRRRRAAKGHAKEEREERAELAPFGEDYGSGGLNRAEIDLFDDDGL